MKTYLKLALASLVALVAMGCQKEGNSVTTPEETGVKEVTTQFVLNVASVPQTKQSAEIVQQANNFRGMDDAVLLTYNSSATGEAYVDKTTTPAAGTHKKFELGKLYTTGTVDADNSNRILQLTIPVGTDAVLFYGKAPKSTSTTVSSENLNGSTDMSISSTPSETMFSVVGRLQNSTRTAEYDATARLMIYVINQSIAASVPALSETESFGGYYALPALTWAELGHQYEYNLKGESSRYQDQGITLSALEEVLGKAYYTFTFIKPDEYRAGSSNAIKKMIIDMYTVINKAYTESGTPTNADEANAKRLAGEVLNKTWTYIDSATGDYMEVSVLKTKIPDSVWSDPTTGFEGAKDLNQYPYGDFGIPEGAAQLGFHPEDGTTYLHDEFYYLHPNQPLVNTDVGALFDPRKYIYPAELLYYTNSALRTSSKSDLAVADYPNGVTPWGTDTNWGSHWNSSVVSSSTRGVAVKNNINYGVAMLKSAVTYASGVTTLYDNRSAMTDGQEANKEISVANAHIELRGVLIGGVNPRYNWQFTRYYTSTPEDPGTFDYSKFDGVIYDDQITTSAIATDAGSPVYTYTLVYDNYDSGQADDAQNKVYVTLEFVNNGDDFWGKENLIKSGSVFYLIAELTPSTSSTSISWPEDHQIPPIYGVDGATVPEGKTAGKSKQIPRVFIQDFVTTATFRLGATALQKAYYSVPDLLYQNMPACR